MTDQTSEIADQLLTFMHLCEDDKHALSVKLKSMDGAIPTMAGARSGGLGDILIPFNDGAPAIWPLNVVTVQYPPADNPDPKDDFPPGSFQFQRLKTIATSDARKAGASRFSRFMVAHYLSTAMPDGTAQSGWGPFSLIGGKWLPSAPNAISYPKLNDDHIKVGIGWALTMRYEWSVWIGYDQGPRIRFISDPTGAREAFRLRDIPEGKQRRAALHNWVTGHWRNRRDAPEDRAWIERHLRGATDFSWNGMRCRIQPPDFSVEELAMRKKTGAA